MTPARSRFFLSGLFVSALGSQTYASILPFSLLMQKVPIWYIGLLMGSLRAASFLMNMFLGHWGDRVHPRRVILFSETGAALCAGLIFLATLSHRWPLALFLIANVLRVCFVSLQIGSTQKFGKLFDENLKLQGRFAIRLNAVNHGALLVGAMIAWSLATKLRLEWFLLFDGVTFALNGLLIWRLQRDAQLDLKISALGRVSNLKTYTGTLPRFAFLDFILALVVCGTNTLYVRLLAGNPDFIPLAPALFGLAAVVSAFGISERFERFGRSTWFLLGITTFAMALSSQIPSLFLVLTFFRNLAYWVIFQNLSRHIMHQGKIRNFAAISAGRNALTISVLSIGDVWSGATAAIPLAIEMGWRALVALIPALGKSKTS